MDFLDKKALSFIRSLFVFFLRPIYVDPSDWIL